MLISRRTSMFSFVALRNPSTKIAFIAGIDVRTIFGMSLILSSRAFMYRSVLNFKSCWYNSFIAS